MQTIVDAALSALDQWERKNGERAIRDDEAEACATLADEIKSEVDKDEGFFRLACRDIADRIRARIQERRPPEGAAPLSDQRERV
jgi:hypothetical protein